MNRVAGIRRNADPCSKPCIANMFGKAKVDVRFVGQFLVRCISIRMMFTHHRQNLADRNTPGSQVVRSRHRSDALQGPRL